MYLQLENIRKSFDTKVAVDNLSLGVPRGSIYGIIGPNGAGKTTTIRMVMNITAPDSGRILVEGKPIGVDFKNWGGYLPEERGLYKKFSVEDVIIYLAQLKGCHAKTIMPRIAPWLERMSLQDYRHRKVEELSKGMQQKLQVITTIIHEPTLLILDELFSGLDPINMELLKEIIMELRRKGTTILFSTHVMEQAEKLCDSICMISGGRKVLDGKLNDIKRQFGKNTIEVEFEGDETIMRGLPGVAGITEFNNYVELRLEGATDPDSILKQIVGKVKIRRFAVMDPSLYSIFIEQARIKPEEYNRAAEVQHA